MKKLTKKEKTALAKRLELDVHKALAVGREQAEKEAFIKAIVRKGPIINQEDIERDRRADQWLEKRAEFTANFDESEKQELVIDKVITNLHEGKFRSKIDFNERTIFDDAEDAIRKLRAQRNYYKAQSEKKAA